MPYKTAYNAQVAQQVRSMSQNHVAREKEINDFATNYEIPSQVESAVMRYLEVHGGSGYAAATVADLGFEPTLGATSSKLRLARDCLRRAFRQRGFSAGSASAGATKRTRRKNGERASRGAVLALKRWERRAG